MADENVRKYSLEEIRRTVARGESRTDPSQSKCPAVVEPDEDFWKRADIVMPRKADRSDD